MQQNLVFSIILVGFILTSLSYAQNCSKLSYGFYSKNSFYQTDMSGCTVYGLDNGKPYMDDYISFKWTHLVEREREGATFATRCHNAHAIENPLLNNYSRYGNISSYFQPSELNCYIIDEISYPVNGVEIRTVSIHYSDPSNPSFYGRLSFHVANTSYQSIPSKNTLNTNGIILPIIYKYV